MECVLILDPRGNINFGGVDTISRHDAYAREMNSHKQLSHLKLVVISIGGRTNIRPSAFDLRVVSARSFNFVQFAFQTAKEIKRTKLAPSLFISGDPWESYWTAKLIRFLSGSNCPIQVQLHGDFCNPIWKSLNFRNRLRSYALGYAIRNSESIRTVSEFQTEFILDRFNIKKEKIFICPPLLNSSHLERKKNPRIRAKKAITIAFVGRLHGDRGINHLKELVAKLQHEKFNFKLMVLGSGPEKKELTEELSKFLPPAQIEFHSFLQPRDMTTFWAQTDLILSLAPSESYGRAMREALLFGIPVLAVESSGVKELVQLVGNQSVLTVNSKDTSVEIIVKVKKLLTAGVSQTTKNKLIEVELRKNSLLIESWYQTMKEFKSKGRR